MKENIAKEKSLLFSIALSEYYLSLKEKRYFEIASQVFRSGTSIGANLRESIWAHSRKDFVYKLELCLKEAYETEYRFEILEKWFKENIPVLKQNLKEIIRLLIVSLRTLKGH